MRKIKNIIDRKSLNNSNKDFDSSNLLEMQINSFDEFLQPGPRDLNRKLKGLEAVLKEYFPLEDVKGESELHYEAYETGKPKYSIKECKERGITYGIPLKIRFSLHKYRKDKKTEEKKFLEKITNDVYLGDIPLMTSSGVFIINGAERVIVSQLHRSPGIFFSEDDASEKRTVSARIIPYRGSWVEFFVDNSGIFINLGRSRKIPVSVLLRALGYSTDEDVLNLFMKTEKVKVSKLKEDISFIGRIISESIVDEATGEVIIEKSSQINENVIKLLETNDIKEIKLWEFRRRDAREILFRTVVNDQCADYFDALKVIYNLIRTGEPPSEQIARSVLERIFFSVRRYDLGDIGRYRINKKLYDTDDKYSDKVLTSEDVVEIVKKMIYYYNNDIELDDIDHLSNRRVRSVGELLEHKFAAALNRLTRIIKEKLSTTKDVSNVNELINARAVYTIVMSFFQTSQLSQFMDQTNPLSELTNKRRLSSLGPGGLSRERAGFEVRDVHYTHYGKICPIETPEGPNIGLIVSLANYARTNQYGILTTPFYKVENKKATNVLEYLTADEEEKYTVAPGDSKLNADGSFVEEFVTVRKKGEYVVIPVSDINYIDVSTFQMVSVSAGLIPFLEHDDANRALMGSNMQRQGVPLLFTEAPMVGTGMERKVAVDSGTVVVSDRDGKVVSADCEKIVIKPMGNDKVLQLLDDDVYYLRKFERSNQNTCINQRPIVSEGDVVKAGDAIADGMATDRGELALGKNVVVAFMCWQGYNFEDAIIMSEELCHNDVFTSLHIQEFEIEVRNTKRGPEEITREVPNYSEEVAKDLDENGIVRVGARLTPGDIMVGKVTPKGETDLSPEEKLLKAIFGERAGDVRDTSLKAEPGMSGVVIDTKLMSRKKQTKKTKQQDREKIEDLEKDIGSKSQSIVKQRNKLLAEILVGEKSGLIMDADTKKVIVDQGTVFTEKIIDRVPFEAIDLGFGIVANSKKNEEAIRIIEKSKALIRENEEFLELEIDKIMRGDELKPDVLQLIKVYVATKKRLSVGDKFAGRHGNKGVVSVIAPVEDMPFMEDGTPVQVVLNPLGIPSRMNIGQLLETHIGWAAYKQGYYVKTPVFSGIDIDTIKKELEKANVTPDGKMLLRDGRSGEYFDNKVTVGVMYMMKLNHLITDKVHSRSIGPYSLITQQPLGGKSQFGGQRFGEMEVWALEAYGASYMLQELLTVKSDDVTGRVKVYEAIVQGDNLPSFGIPESFKVLMSEIRALGIDLYVE